MKNPIMEEKNLKKLISLLKIEKILEPEEWKFFIAPQKYQEPMPAFKRIQPPIALYQAIDGSEIFTVESYLNSLDQELKKLGKTGKADLVYKASRDGNSSKTLWNKCKNHKETITLV